MINLRGIILPGLLLAIFITANVMGMGQIREGHNCSLWAVISDSLPDSVIYNHLIEYPNSLKNRSEWGDTDGWGIAAYDQFGEAPSIYRGGMRAFRDSSYDSVVDSLEDTTPEIILAHIRNCTSGCCCHLCDSIPDPHPFTRFKDGKSWSFIHNGYANIQMLYQLIGQPYLLDNPLSGSGIPECDPSDTSLVVDSELLFLYLLKNFEEFGWNVTNGIITAMLELIGANSRGLYNFIISDGYRLWVFCNGLPLYIHMDSTSNFDAAATLYPSETQDNWYHLGNFELAILNSDDVPILIEPDYLPGDINGDDSVIGSDVTYGVRYFSMEGDVPPDSCYNDSTGSWLYSAADVNGDCRVIGSDITYLVNFFRGQNQGIKWCPETPPLTIPR
ncbi:MAG: hypothetical protein GY839_03005 [candidate division Zixibacteria bacterium]|nr:hypothetical protein [candidate division Zixibacteria bacterium]